MLAHVRQGIVCLMWTVSCERTADSVYTCLDQSELLADFAVVECMQEGKSGCTFLPQCKLRHTIHAATGAFLKVLDEKTLAVPDRPGNHRFDSFLNIMQTGRIGLVFLVPNRREVVRVAGSAQVVRDLELREQLAVNDKVPDFVVLVRVEEAFYHCGKAVIRSRLWEPEAALPIDGLPSYAAAVKDHAELEDPVEEINELFMMNEQYRLYDEELGE